MHERRKRPVGLFREMNMFINLGWRRNYLERYLLFAYYVYHCRVRRLFDALGTFRKERERAEINCFVCGRGFYIEIVKPLRGVF